MDIIGRHWLLLLLLGIPACRQPARGGPAEARLYDLSGCRLLSCSLAPSGNGAGQGSIRCRTANGEAFQGEWTRLDHAVGDPDEETRSKYESSLPTFAARPDAMGLTWGWSADFGIDFEHFPKTYFSFLLFGDSGTIINGFFLERASMSTGIDGLFQRTFLSQGFLAGGLLGAAKDNHGHRYKLMG